GAAAVAGAGTAVGWAAAVGGAAGAVAGAGAAVGAAAGAPPQALNSIAVSSNTSPKRLRMFKMKFLSLSASQRRMEITAIASGVAWSAAIDDEGQAGRARGAAFEREQAIAGHELGVLVGDDAAAFAGDRRDLAVAVGVIAAIDPLAECHQPRGLVFERGG